ncbi:hypothetical protein J3Q64DRAFT_1696845 [Phycomyces blakesleeanus]|uniref:Uncharacterized protein n=2 Tax=Phycomyces blakesleeanus TaxID=4837 RepID=A0A167NK01_PHYB8|nr:hypothetical protein PHYBLDRAFT_186134 [Phycomyces blakesleeanus NRRL 1555(-)]OAD76108.1 hypothetical protein PHYBLDRAFT_186134 [Phycomyces blakesleeanus NRRL 1555(-)]|eukprot:XP_018294148.1 hypothetical protein PHYBLDRAFT_186134 [Phycomyces blakesleeanus NRRL 1555(-)]
MVTPASMEQLSFGDSEATHCTSWAMLSTAEPQGKNNIKEHYNCIRPTNDCFDFEYFDTMPMNYLDTEPDNDSQVFRFPKLNSSQSTPTRPSSAMSGRSDTSLSEQDAEGQSRFLNEIGKAREQLMRFRNEMDGLAKQMDGIEIDLRDSKNRVLEIEEDLTTTQEVNVNLQVILERAVSRQKETDVSATRTMKHIHADLASVVQQNSQLQGRLATIASYQREYQGNATDVVERMREYAEMLEQAQGTIQMLQFPRIRSGMPEDMIIELAVQNTLGTRRLSETSDTSTLNNELESDRMIKDNHSHHHPLNLGLDLDLDLDHSLNHNHNVDLNLNLNLNHNLNHNLNLNLNHSRQTVVSPDTTELYRHRIIRKRTSLPGRSLGGPSLSLALPPQPIPLSKPMSLPSRLLPQQGLKLLLNKSQGGLGGLGGLT